jgi:hypothetical protein
MFPLIETAAAFAAVMLVASLFVSAIVQALQSAMGLRARGLEDMLLTLIHNYAELHDEEGLSPAEEQAFVQAIVNHPLLHSKQAQTPKSPRGVPRPGAQRRIEYLDQDDLLALVRMEMNREDGRGHKDVVKRTVSNLEEFVAFVERWYETVGATASQYFKHRMRQLTLLVSCLVVVLFNFDGLHLIGDLHRDGTQRAALTREIEALHDTSRSLESKPAGDTLAAELQALKREMNETSKLLRESGVDVGWQSSFIARRLREGPDHEHPGYARLAGELLLWLAGLGFSCVMLSLGAPFWATTLGSLVNLTNAVQKAKSGSGGDAPKDRDQGKDRKGQTRSEEG